MGNLHSDLSIKKEESVTVKSELSTNRSAVYFERNHLMADIGGHTVRGGAVTILSHGLKFAVGIIATAILARLLTPQDYGLIGMVAVTTNFCGTGTGEV